MNTFSDICHEISLLPCSWRLNNGAIRSGRCCPLEKLAGYGDDGPPKDVWLSDTVRKLGVPTYEAQRAARAAAEIRGTRRDARLRNSGNGF